jgi:hypothetical protein
MSLEIEVPPPFSRDATMILELNKAARNRLKWFEWGGTGASIFNAPQSEIIRLALQRPYLMHTVLAVSALHQRHQSLSAPGPQSKFEAYHASVGARLFYQHLSQRIQSDDRDSIWITATLLGIIAFASPSTCKAAQSWPLNLDKMDLEWLRMTRSKRVVWNLANPLREDSLLRNMAQEYEEMFQVDTSTQFQELPTSLAELCGLEPHSTTENNPYYTALLTLSPLLSQPIQSLSRSRALAFTSQMTPSFERLLRDEDPVALLLLALWYDIVRQVIWWSRPRARVEHQSISLYLKQKYPNREKIQRLLR